MLLILLLLYLIWCEAHLHSPHLVRIDCLRLNLPREGIVDEYVSNLNLTRMMLSRLELSRRLSRVLHLTSYRKESLLAQYVQVWIVRVRFRNERFEGCVWLRILSSLCSLVLRRRGCIDTARVSLWCTFAQHLALVFFEGKFFGLRMHVCQFGVITKECWLFVVLLGVFVGGRMLHARLGD